jgi:hypothetical protein
MQKITLSILLLLSMFSFGQSVQVTFAELKVLNIDATTINFGTGVQSVNVHIKASVYSSFANSTTRGSLGVYYKKNGNTSTTPIIPTNGFDSAFYMLNGSTQTRVFTITLYRSDFDTTGGYVYLEYKPDADNLGSAYKSSNVIVTKIPDPISNNIISGNQTVYDSQAVSTISGSNPAGGDGTFIYKWQQKVGNGSWADISGATSVNYTPPASTLTTSYRRIVTSAGTIVGTSNEVTVTVITTLPIQNNTISLLSGSELQGSTPTGGINTYTYRWLVYVLEDLDPVVIEQRTKDCSVPESVYQFMENVGVANAAIVREVSSGSKASISNVILITPAQPINNNVITLSGNNITGSIPTGGTGSFRYEYYVYNEFPDGEVVDGVTMVGSTLNYTGVVQGYLTTKYYRRVVSGNKSSFSNTITILPLASAAKKAVTSNETATVDFVVYPNPTTEALNFTTNFAADKEIEIVVYSEKLGNEKSVFKGTVTPNQVVNWSIPSNYSKGLYFYKVKSGGAEIKTGKIIYQ